MLLEDWETWEVALAASLDSEAGLAPSVVDLEDLVAFLSLEDDRMFNYSSVFSLLSSLYYICTCCIVG